MGIVWVVINERLAAKMGESVINIIQLHILSPEEGPVPCFDKLVACLLTFLGYRLQTNQFMLIQLFCLYQVCFCWFLCTTF